MSNLTALHPNSSFDATAKVETGQIAQQSVSVTTVHNLHMPALQGAHLSMTCFMAIALGPVSRPESATMF